MKKVISALCVTVLLFSASGRSFAQDSRPRKSGAAMQSERAEQIKRDASRLEQVKTIAVLPILVQYGFEKDLQFPDPNRMTSRLAILTRLPEIIESELKASKYTVLPQEAGSLALKESNIEVTDLYQTHRSGTWDAPAESKRNRSKDDFLLLTGYDDLKKNADQVTLFQFKWHNLPATMNGLAAYRMDADASLDTEKVKALGAKVNADAILIARITNLEMHRSGNGSIALPIHLKGRVDIQFTLVSRMDGAVIWEARAHAMKSERGRPQSFGPPQDRNAIACAVGAVELLLDDLNHGTGITAK